MRIESLTKVVRTAVVYGAQPGGVCSTPVEVSRTYPNGLYSQAKSYEHPVVPIFTTGPSTVQPHLPINSSNLLSVDLP